MVVVVVVAVVVVVNPAVVVIMVTGASPPQQAWYKALGEWRRKVISVFAMPISSSEPSPRWGSCSNLRLCPSAPAGLCT